MSEKVYKSFAEFWPHYLAEHSKPQTRLLHLLGTAMALGALTCLLATGRWYLSPIALIPGYGAAWIGHFFVEKNKPATFQHPLWSFIGDYKMIGIMLTGKMDAELARHSRLDPNNDG
ncbi:MAG: Mpo1-like protein [Pyrinomonadaceae bacterium]